MMWFQCYDAVTIDDVPNPNATMKAINVLAAVACLWGFDGDDEALLVGSLNIFLILRRVFLKYINYYGGKIGTPDNVRLIPTP